MKVIERQSITLNSVIFRFAITLSVLTLFQPYIGWINRVTMGLALVLLLLSFLNQSSSFPIVALVFGMSFSWVVAMLFTGSNVHSINDLFYFPFWVLFYCWVIKNRNTLVSDALQARSYINSILVIWTAIVFVSVFLPSSYDTRWGGHRYFASITGDPFRFIPTALLVISLAIFMALITHNRKYEIFFLMPLYGAFMSGARTYFGLIVLITLCYLYIRIGKLSRFIPIAIVLIIGGLAVFPYTGLAGKLDAVQYSNDSYYDFWGTFTSGRTVFWRHHIEGFQTLPIWQRFVGNGFNYVYDLSSQILNKSIWAHNDFINLILNFGFLGLFSYLATFWMLVKNVWSTPEDGARLSIPLAVQALFLSAVFLNSMFNMSYTYLNAVVAYALILLATAEFYRSSAATLGAKNLSAETQQHHLACSEKVLQNA